MPLLASSIWLTAILVKGIAVCRLWRHRRLFPWLIAFLAASVVRSTVLLMIRGEHAALYREVMTATAPVLMAMETMAVISIFWRLTEQYPNWRRAGTVCLLAICALGVGGAWLLHWVGVPSHSAAYVLQRHWMLALGIAVMLMLQLARLTSSEWLPIRPIAVRAAQCLAVSCGGGTATALLVMQAGTGTPWWVYTVGPMMGVLNGLLCAFWLPRASAECPAYVRPSREECSQMDAISEWGIEALRAGQIHLSDRQARGRWTPSPPPAAQSQQATAE